MPYVAFCKICKENFKKDDLSKDESIAYMISEKPVENIESKIIDHFKKLHGIVPAPNPFSLSWNSDFKKVLFELPQYGDDEHEFELMLPFRGPSVRQFDCKQYTISVITSHDYNQCITLLKVGGRIDTVLYHYNYPSENYLE